MQRALKSLKMGVVVSSCERQCPGVPEQSGVQLENTSKNSLHNKSHLSLWHVCLNVYLSRFIPNLQEKEEEGRRKGEGRESVSEQL